jgi:hypothetical protein
MNKMRPDGPPQIGDCGACANGEQPPRIQYPAPPGFSAMGYMFRRLSLRR